jgi:hypothetical protein
MNTILDKLSLIKEGPDDHIWMFDGDQIALEDAPGIMIFDTDDEALIENAELDNDKVVIIRNNYSVIKSFLENKGFKVVSSNSFYDEED